MRVTFIIAGILTVAGIGMFLAPANVSDDLSYLVEDANLADEISAEPIVWPDEELVDREAGVQAQAQDVAPPPPPPQAEIFLLGITQEGTTPRAWVRINQQPVFGVDVGDRADRWDVAAIETTSITLVSGEERRIIRLYGPD